MSIALAIAAVFVAAPAAAQREYAVPGVTARGEREQCGRRDDPRARALWERVRARYDAASDTLSLWSAVTVSTGVVPPGRVGQFDTVAAPAPEGYNDRWDTVTEVRDARQALHQVRRLPAVGGGMRGMSGVQRAYWAARIARGGYAAPAGSSDLSGAFEAWEYPPLDAEMADHFVSAPFGAMARFALVADEGATKLAFCARPRDGDGAALVGALALAPDTTLAGATWRFLHRDGSGEEAGGSVVFARSPADGGRRVLLAGTGVYYRRQGGTYFQRRQVFEGWRSGGRVALPASLSRGPVNALRPGVDPGPARFPTRGRVDGRP